MADTELEVGEAVERSGKKLEVILQVNKKALDEAFNMPEYLAEQLDDYHGVIHRILLNESMGRGVPMNPKRLLPFIRAVRKSDPNIGIGIAGGLGPDTVHLIKPLIEEFPDLSIDAQGKLRPSGNALDPIDWRIAEKYLANAAKILT